jgi:4-amino-4-deoxy-L-arabinose transferase-like glycosyltransferase
MLLTTLMIYGYGRTFLSPLGALAAGTSFATLGTLFKTGRQAETDALFIFLVSASLLVWHWGLLRRGPSFLTWASGYGLMALGMLTKGLQAPTYFVGAVGAYLVLTGQWRRLFSRAHFLGAGVGAGVVLAWALPYGRVLGWQAVHDVWLGDPALTHHRWSLGEFLTHLLMYPLETLGCTLPWSPLLLLCLRRDFRRSLGEARPQALFQLLCLAVAFPTCWLPPGGRARFFTPLYPCLAVLIGLVIQRCAEAGLASPLRVAWRWYLRAISGAMLVAGLAVVALGCCAPSPALAPNAEPPLVALAYAVVVAGLAVLVYRARAACSPSQVRFAVLALAWFLVLTYTGVVTNACLRRSQNDAEAIAQLKEQLPPGQQLVSIDGHTDALFAYLYGRPLIVPGRRPAPGSGPGADVTYFCFTRHGNNSQPPLPFAWEEVGAVCTDRYHQPTPDAEVVVGRRLPAPPPSSLQAGTADRRPSPMGSRE